MLCGRKGFAAASSLCRFVIKCWASLLLGTASVCHGPLGFIEKEQKKRKRTTWVYRGVHYESLRMSISNTTFRIRRDVVFHCHKRVSAVCVSLLCLSFRITQISTVVTVTDYRHNTGVLGIWIAAHKTCLEKECRILNGKDIRNMLTPYLRAHWTPWVKEEVVVCVHVCLAHIHTGVFLILAHVAARSRHRDIYIEIYIS